MQNKCAIDLQNNLKEFLVYISTLKFIPEIWCICLFLYLMYQHSIIILKNEIINNIFYYL